MYTPSSVLCDVIDTSKCLIGAALRIWDPAFSLAVTQKIHDMFDSLIALPVVAQDYFQQAHRDKPQKPA